MTDYDISGAVPLNGALKQFSTFRYHGGLGHPAIEMDYWTYSNGIGGGSDTYLRFGLRDSSGTQVTSSVQIDPGENYVWVGWGYVAPGMYALNARSQVYRTDVAGAYTNFVGTLRLG